MYKDYTSVINTYYAVIEILIPYIIRLLRNACKGVLKYIKDSYFYA